MPTYMTPGVYVEETSSGEKPIAGVGTGTGGFVGITERGPVGKPVLITNMVQYKKIFGGHLSDWVTPYAVEQFFKEGGSKCWVVRTVHYNAGTPLATKTSGSASLTLNDTGGTNPSLKIDATSDGAWINNFSVAVEDGTVTGSFKLILKNRNGDEVESFDNLTMANVESKVASDYIRITVSLPTASAAETLPPKITANAPFTTKGNDGLDDGANSTITIADFSGDALVKNGLHAFDTIDDVNLIAMPDMHFVNPDEAVETDTKDGIQEAVIYCEKRKDCFFIADMPAGKTPQEALTFKQTHVSSSYAAIYYPWIEASFGGDPVDLPPSGAVMGVISRTDARRGVHKAPAGTIDGKLRTVSGLELDVTHGEQESLNVNGVNVIRFFPGPGNLVWGARTCASGVDAEWMYLNIRRYFMYVEESLDEGTQWVVFEPNTPGLWGSVKRNITAFLMREWRNGALFGNSPEEAFYVWCDETNNPPEERALGRLIIEVGIAPIRPAEFVIIRISQKTQSS